MKKPRKNKNLTPVKIGSYLISVRQLEEFHRLKSEIFSQHVYYFESSNPQPKIIDVGAHIGLSTLYFKKLFPGAEILAIEPLSQSYQLLEENIWQNGLKNVEALPVALWAHQTQIPLYFDQTQDQWFSTASSHPQAWNGQQQTTSVMVPTQTLSSLLNEPVDFLKLDIEGAEQAVLDEALGKLHFVKEMVIEFHPVGTQSLAAVLDLLDQNGFRTLLWKDGKEIPLGKARGLLYIRARQRT